MGDAALLWGSMVSCTLVLSAGVVNVLDGSQPCPGAAPAAYPCLQPVVGLVPHRLLPVLWCPSVFPWHIGDCGHRGAADWLGWGLLQHTR